MARAAENSDPFAVASTVRLYDDLKRCCDIRVNTEGEITTITEKISDISHAIVRARHQVRQTQDTSGGHTTSGTLGLGGGTAENLDELARQRDALVHKAVLLTKLSHNQQQATEALVSAGDRTCGEGGADDPWIERCRDLVATHVLTVENMQLRRQMACSVGQLHWEASTGVNDLRDAIIDRQRTLLAARRHNGDGTVPASLTALYSELESSKEVARVMTDSIASNGILSVAPRRIPPPTSVADNEVCEEDSPTTSPEDMTRNSTVQPMLRQGSNTSSKRSELNRTATRSERVDTVAHAPSAKARVVSATGNTSHSRPKRSTSPLTTPAALVCGTGDAKDVPTPTRARGGGGDTSGGQTPVDASGMSTSGDADATEQHILRTMRASVDNSRDIAPPPSAAQITSGGDNAPTAAPQAQHKRASPPDIAVHATKSRVVRPSGLGETYSTDGMTRLAGDGNIATQVHHVAASQKPRRGTYDLEPCSPTLPHPSGASGNMQRTFTKARVMSAGHWIDSASPAPPPLAEEDTEAPDPAGTASGDRGNHSAALHSDPVDSAGGNVCAGTSATTSGHRRLKHSTFATDDATRGMQEEAPTPGARPHGHAPTASDDDGDVTVHHTSRTSVGGTVPEAPTSLPGLTAMAQTPSAAHEGLLDGRNAVFGDECVVADEARHRDGSAGRDCGPEGRGHDIRRLTQPAVVATNTPLKRTKASTHVTSSVSAASIYGLSASGVDGTSVARGDKNKRASDGHAASRIAQQAVTPQLLVHGKSNGNGGIRAVRGTKGVGTAGSDRGSAHVPATGARAHPKGAATSSLAFGLRTSPYAAAPRHARGVRVKTRPRP